VARDIARVLGASKQGQGYLHGNGYIVTGLTLRVQPQDAAGLKAFLASCLYIAGMLASAAFGVYPYVLPSNSDPALGLTIHNTATSHHGLAVGLAWWIPGMLLALGYFVYAYRHFAGKVRIENEGY
jgi:cytochrome bd-type quinol oxidase subunit 2